MYTATFTFAKREFDDTHTMSIIAFLIAAVALAITPGPGIGRCQLS
jgi:hypothetical protein